jgi:hypothetical protein
MAFRFVEMLQNGDFTHEDIIRYGFEKGHLTATQVHSILGFLTKHNDPTSLLESWLESLRPELTANAFQELQALVKAQIVSPLKETIANQDLAIGEDELPTVLGDASFLPVQTEAGLGQREARLTKELHLVLSADPSYSPHADFFFKEIEQLGAGGMGQVLLIEDHRLDRKAALKTILGEYASDLAIARFRREARITAQLNHPSIPPIYEAGRNAAGREYMLMPVIQGKELGTLIKESQEDFGKGDWRAWALGHSGKDWRGHRICP